MKFYNPRSNPAQWEKIAESINEWAKSELGKARQWVNPEHVFTTSDWDIPNYSDYRSRPSRSHCKLPLSLVVKGKINTSVFEEAEIVEYLIN